MREASKQAARSGAGRASGRLRKRKGAMSCTQRGERRRGEGRGVRQSRRKVEAVAGKRVCAAGTHSTQFRNMNANGSGFSAPRLALRRAACTCCCGRKQDVRAGAAAQSDAQTHRQRRQEHCVGQNQA